MHDLLRDLAITRAKEENFFTVFSKEGDDVNQLAARKPRRAALQFCNLTKDGVYSENTRSLLCFGVMKYPLDDHGLGQLNYSGFRLLRVLTLKHVDMSKFAGKQWPKSFAHLRYLDLRECYIPQDIFKKFFFCNLETIDLDEARVVDSDHEVIHTIDLYDVVIPTLRYVRGSRCFYLPLKWDQHTNLQTMVNKSMQIELVVELQCCINLRTLLIRIVGDIRDERAQKEHWENLKDVLRRTKQLVSLGIGMGESDLLPFGGTTDLPCHGRIQKLLLWGRWGRNICVPSVEMFPTNITKLTLVLSELEEDLIPILERLQSLRELSLGYHSYVGTHLICSTGGFPNLQKLKLKELSNLCHWDIKEGAMPILTHLEIYECENLHALPELQKVRTLQELSVIYPSPVLRKSMEEKDQQYKLEHIPYVRIR